MQGLGVNPAGDVHVALIGRIGDERAAQPGVSSGRRAQALGGQQARLAILRQGLVVVFVAHARPDGADRRHEGPVLDRRTQRDFPVTAGLPESLLVLPRDGVQVARDMQVHAGRLGHRCVEIEIARLQVQLRAAQRRAFVSLSGAVAHRVRAAQARGGADACRGLHGVRAGVDGLVQLEIVLCARLLVAACGSAGVDVAPGRQRQPVGAAELRSGQVDVLFGGPDVEVAAEVVGVFGLGIPVRVGVARRERCADVERRGVGGRELCRFARHLQGHLAGVHLAAFLLRLGQRVAQAGGGGHHARGQRAVDAGAQVTAGREAVGEVEILGGGHARGADAQQICGDGARCRVCALAVAVAVDVGAAQIGRVADRQQARAEIEIGIAMTGHARYFVFARRFEPDRGIGAGGLASPGVRLQTALRAQVDAGLVAAGAGGQSEEQLIHSLCAFGIRMVGGCAGVEIVGDLQVGLLEAGAAALDIDVRGMPAQHRALQRRALEARVAGGGGFGLRRQQPQSLVQAVPAGLRIAAVDVIQAAQPDLFRLQADMVARERSAGAVQPFGGNVQQARGIGAAVQARVVARDQPAACIVARAGGQADPLAREMGLRGVQQPALDRDVAAPDGQRAQRPRAAGDAFVVGQADSAARSIQDDVLAQECRIAGFDRRAAGVGEHRARRRHERAAGLARGARGRPRRASQVYPRRKHLLAVDRFPYVPDEVAAGARQLFGGRRLAHAQPQLGGRQRRRLHQRPHQRQAAHGVAVLVAAHGARDLFADQPGLEIIVADGPQWSVRPVADQVEEIPGAVIVALVEIGQARFVQGLGQVGRRGRYVVAARPGDGARRRGAREQAPVLQQGMDAVLECHRGPGVGMADRVDGAARRLDPLFADVHGHVPGQQAGDVLAIGDAPARQHQAGAAGQHGLLRRIEGQFAAGCASLGGDAMLEAGVARHQGGAVDRAAPVRPEHRRHGLGEQRHGRPPGRQGGLVE